MTRLEIRLHDMATETRKDGNTCDFKLCFRCSHPWVLFYVRTSRRGGGSALDVKICENNFARALCTFSADRPVELLFDLEAALPSLQLDRPGDLAINNLG